ncbi:hypothetical protein N7G274_008829 [Stereocaulon virgatum]|uniref:Uncharacterized protein n=1 Tax=Stereocaulon virgatum TaxID=373712 RepID=A0ABR4A0A4_9LECA
MKSPPHPLISSSVILELQEFASVNGQQPGSPSKAVARIIEAVVGTEMAGHLKGKVLRMPLGDDSVKWYEEKAKSMEGDLEAVREVAGSTGF